MEIPPPPPPPSHIVPPPPPSDIRPPPPPPSSDVNGENAVASSVVLPRKRKLAPTSAKQQPLSMEELLAKKQAQDAEAAKPKFVSKKERERLAQEREKRDEEAARAKKVEAQAGKPATNGHKAPPPAPRAMRNGEPPKGPAAMRNLHNKDHDMRPPPPPPKSAAIQDGQKTAKKQNETDVEAEMIRTRYMGADTNMSTFSAKKKRKRTTEKKFNFEWNAEEDTSPDYNPLYQARSESTFFGRGKLGGFAEDVNDTIARKYARAIEERDPEAGRQRAAEILEMERRRREEAREHERARLANFQRRLQHFNERRIHSKPYAHLERIWPAKAVVGCCGAKWLHRPNSSSTSSHTHRVTVPGFDWRRCHWFR